RASAPAEPPPPNNKAQPAGPPRTCAMLAGRASGRHTNGTSLSVSRFHQTIWDCSGRVQREPNPIVFILFLVDYTGNRGRLDEALEISSEEPGSPVFASPSLFWPCA